MSWKKFVAKVEGEIGVELGRLDGQEAVAASIATKVQAALANPVVKGVLGLVLPPNIMAQYPKAEQVLSTVVTDLTIGSSIEGDIKAATTPEAKLQVFITDMQKYGIARQNMFLQKMESLVLAGLDDNALKENLYDLYTQAKYSLSKKV
jgi:hypothetical protein